MSSLTPSSSSIGDARGGGSSAGSSKISPSTSNITLADLTACVRRTSGTRPPPLVGCSLTLVGDFIYLFGGRLVPTRTMVSTLYSLSLRTLEWSRLWPPASSDGTDTAADDSQSANPVARYFHSAEAWGSKIVIFGGEGYSPIQEGESVDQVPLRTLGDVLVWDTVTSTWEFPNITCEEGVDPPAPRYAHLGVVTTYTEEKRGRFEIDVGAASSEKSLLVIMGGQDIKNTYLHTVNVLDLNEMKWVRVGKWDRHIGTYRAVATTGKWSVIPGGVSPPLAAATSPTSTTFEDQLQPVEGNGMGLQKGESLTQLSYSERPTKEKAEPLLIFSNFNFTQVRRDLDLLSSPAPPNHPLDASSLSTLMAGVQLPPGLRFPTGTVVGRHMLIFGTYLSHTINTFSIWALDLGAAGGAGVTDMLKDGKELTWSRVDPGNVLSKGSWNRAVGWKNSVVVLGDRERDIATDYDHRQTNFTHVAFVDLEAFGIYQPPPQTLPPLAQSFGLLTLSQPFLADFEIICSDGARLGCSRKILDDRWPWFRERMDDFKARAKGILAAQKKRFEQLPVDSTLADVTSSTFGGPELLEDDTTTPRSPTKSSTELRLTPRTLNLPEPAAVVQGFLQYLYTLTLCTPHQLSLPVLSALLVFSKTYEEANLRALVVHALHEALNKGTWTAGAIYEAATLGGCTALQIRALRIMISTPRGASRKGNDPTDSTTTSDFVSKNSPPLVEQAPPSTRQRTGGTPTPLPGVLASRQPRFSSFSGTASSTLANAHRRSISETLIHLPPSDGFSPPRSRPRPRPLPISPCLVPLPDSPQAPITPPASTTPPTPSTPPPRPIRLPNDRVSVPVPDEDVAPIPVPVWSSFPITTSPLVPITPPLRAQSVSPRPPRKVASPGSLRRSNSAGSRGTVGYFDVIPGLLSDPESATESDGNDVFGSPKSTSTTASSLHSNSAGKNQRHTFGERDLPARLRLPLPIEPPVEEVEEPVSVPTSPGNAPEEPHQGEELEEELGQPDSPIPSRPPTPFAYNPTRPKSRPNSIASARSTPGNRSSLASNKSKMSAKSKSRKPKRLDREPGWQPSGIGYLDTCKTGDPNASPLSSRVATTISPEAMASLDNLVFQSSSTTISTSAPATTTLFGSSPRKAAARPRTAPEDAAQAAQATVNDRRRFSDLVGIGRRRSSEESRRSSKKSSRLGKEVEVEVMSEQEDEKRDDETLSARPSCDSTRVNVGFGRGEGWEDMPSTGIDGQSLDLSPPPPPPQPLSLLPQQTIIIPLRPNRPIPPLPPHAPAAKRETFMSGRLVRDPFVESGVTMISVPEPDRKASMCASVHSSYSTSSVSGNGDTDGETSGHGHGPLVDEAVPPLPSVIALTPAPAPVPLSKPVELAVIEPVVNLSKEANEKGHGSVVAVFPASPINKEALFAKAAAAAAAPPRSLSFFKARQQAALAKRVQREAELALGAQLLRVAGASEAEVALRARAVGYAMLRRKETEELESKKQEKDRKREERLTLLTKGSHGGDGKRKSSKTGKTESRHEVGAPLVSTFSIGDESDG